MHITSSLHAPETGGSLGNNVATMTEDAPASAEAAAGGSGFSGGGAFVGEDGAFVEGWTGRLPETLGDARQNFSRFRSVSDLATSYHSLQQRLGRAADAVLVPGANATPEEVSAYRQAIGVPATADAYRVRPDDLPEEMQWNDANVKPYLEVGHKHGIPEQAMRELIATHVQQEKGRFDLIGHMAEEQAQQQLAAGTEHLKRTWGADYEANKEHVAQVVRSLGVDPAKAAGLTDPDTVILIQRLAAKISDDRFVTGAGGDVSGGSARARDIMTNADNPLYRKYQDGDSDTVDLVRGLLQRG